MQARPPLRRLFRTATQLSPAAIFARRTVPSTPASGPRAGADGARRPRGRTVHMAVDTLGHLLAWHVTAATVPERTQGAEWAAQVQAGTGEPVAVAFGEPGDTGEQPVPDAAAQGLHLAGVKLPEAARGVVLVPRRWVVERRVAWTAHFRRLSRADERWPNPFLGLHLLAGVILLRKRFGEWMT